MRKIKLLGILTILIISTFFSLSILKNGHNWGGDFAGYIMQAQSLIEGNPEDFIKHNTVTIEDSDVDFAPIVYPWGYPLLITPIIYFTNTNILGIKLLNLIFYLFFLFTLFLLFERRLSFFRNIILVSVFAFNPLLLSFSNYIFSDIPFLFFSTLNIFIICRFLDEIPTSNQYLRQNNV